METYLFLLIFLPFCGALILALMGGILPRRAVETIACVSVFGSFLMAVLSFLSSGPRPIKVDLLPWITAGDFSAPMSVYYDPLSAVMGLMVTFVSGLIHLYSVGFMRDEEGYARFFCFLNLFVFAMLVVTLADNLLFLYLGWEGVGFCSYALIGFWYADAVKATAGRKAFILTRIGDVAFGIAVAAFFFLLNDLSLAGINSSARSLNPEAATALGLLLLWAAIGKSAQLPLAVWLPDAMAGPTPVSALIHAATMVTAGVYLLMRFFPVLSLSPFALQMVALVGAVSSIFAACAALAQRDIKKVLAYSTISQVSYMFLGVGSGDVTGSMFHLLGHAFFKALLFLAAGCIIQALHEEHDIFRMGNLRRAMPAVFVLFLTGALSLAAIPPFGGFFSKDHILLATFSHPDPFYKFLGGLAEIASFLTALYTFRLFFLVFQDRPRIQGDEVSTAPPGLPGVMTWTLWPLAALSLIAGALNFPAIFSGNEWLGKYLTAVPGSELRLPVSHGTEAGVLVASALISLAALGLSFRLYRPGAGRLMAPAGTRLERLFFSGFHLDRFYAVVFAGPYQRIAKFLWEKIDEGIVDRGLEGAAQTLPAVSAYLRLWTTGRLSTYLLMIFLGFAGILGMIVLLGR